jgi:hypothetical protein
MQANQLLTIRSGQQLLTQFLALLSAYGMARREDDHSAGDAVIWGYAQGRRKGFQVAIRHGYDTETNFTARPSRRRSRVNL